MYRVIGVQEQAHWAHRKAAKELERLAALERQDKE